MRLPILALLALACARVATAGDFTMPGERGQRTGRVSPAGVVSANGGPNAPAMIFTGRVFNGTSSTAMPMVLIQPKTLANSSNWLTNGTAFGINVPSTTNYVVDFQSSGTSVFHVGSDGNVVTTGTLGIGTSSNFNWTSGGSLSSPGTGKIQIGQTDAAAPVAQSLKVQNVVAGTSNTAGAAWNIEASAGTGTGAGGSINLRTAPARTSATTQNPEQTAVTIDQKSHVGLSSAAIPTIGTCGTGSPTVTAGSTDNAGEFTTGTTATACTLTFKQTFAAAPFCVLSDKTTLANLTSFTISTSALVLTMTSNSGDVVEYLCSGI